MSKKFLAIFATLATLTAATLISTAADAAQHGPRGPGGVHRVHTNHFKGLKTVHHTPRFKHRHPDWRYNHRPHWVHRHHPRWYVGYRYRPYYVAPASYAVSRVATTDRCSCLSKEYTPEGAVLFKDLCTKEAAMNPPAPVQQQTGFYQSTPPNALPQQPIPQAQ